MYVEGICKIHQTLTLIMLVHFHPYTQNTRLILIPLHHQKHEVISIYNVEKKKVCVNIFILLIHLM